MASMESRRGARKPAARWASFSITASIHIRPPWYRSSYSPCLARGPYRPFACISLCGTCSWTSIWRISRSIIRVFCICRGRMTSRCGWVRRGLSFQPEKREKHSLTMKKYVVRKMSSCILFVNTVFIYLSRKKCPFSSTAQNPGRNITFAVVRLVRQQSVVLRLAVWHPTGPSHWNWPVCQWHSIEPSVYRLPDHYVSNSGYHYEYVKPKKQTTINGIYFHIFRSYRKRTGKMRPFGEAMRPLFPFLIEFVIATVWVTFSQNNILDLEPTSLFLTFGTIFSNISVSARADPPHFTI